MMMQGVFVCALVWCLMASPSHTAPHPAFGSKRSHRSHAAPQQIQPPQPQPQPHHAQPAVPPYYNQHYYNQPMSMPMPLQPQGDGYVTENGYYYYPNHDYQTFGTPTYHGEYYPQPYYYAPAPKYSYYDDQEMPASPLDDLHEEILHEDQNVYGHDSWYKGARQIQRDAQTNNFMRNLIAYNQQVDAEQNYQKDQHSDYEDYGDFLPTDYDYDPQPTQYFHREAPEVHHNARDKFNEIDDDEVRQLKSLAKHHPIENKHDQRGSMSQYDEEDDNGGLEYDINDDAWISWDRKRSSNAAGESIKAFSNRKPNLRTLQPATTTTTKTTKSTTTTTSKPHLTKATGQKEVVLPRPATPQRHLFAPPAQDLIHNQLEHGADSREGDESGDADKHSGESSLTTGLESLRKYDDDQKRSKVGESSENIYDTIKQLIAMEQQLEKKQKSPIHKRFVSNAEILVRELDSLKRRPI